MGYRTGTGNAWGSSTEYESEVHRPSGSKRRPNMAMLRNIYTASTEGGTAVCEYCHTRYCAAFIRMCYVTTFRQGMVCNDCRKRFSLRVV
jgi:hypothetical protein